MKYFIDTALKTFAFEDSDTEEFIAQYAQPDWVQIPNLPIETTPTYDQLTQSAVRDGCEQVDGKWQYKWRIDALTPEQIEAKRLASIPSEVTMRQARLALLGAGLLAGVDAAIASLPEPAKSAALIDWEYAAVVQRSSGLVPAMGAALGMTEAQIDDLFIQAATL